MGRSGTSSNFTTAGNAAMLAASVVAFAGAVPPSNISRNCLVSWPSSFKSLSIRPRSVASCDGDPGKLTMVSIIRGCCFGSSACSLMSSIVSAYRSDVAAPLPNTAAASNPAGGRQPFSMALWYSVPPAIPPSTPVWNHWCSMSSKPM